MLGKLLKNDLRKNMRWLWILFVGAIVSAGLTRGCTELGQNIAFFKILAIIFDSVFYAVLVNVLLQPFLRSFLNFTKSLYGDESYLTHTLPVTKNQIITSKYLTALIEISLGFVCVFVAVLIKFASPTFIPTLQYMLSTVVTGDFSVYFVLALFVTLVTIEFLMFISVIFFSIILGYKSNEKKVLNTFIITVAFSMLAYTILSIAMLIIMLANGIDLTSETLVLSSSAFYGIMISGIVIYSIIGVVFYFLARKEFNKGVNVD